MSVRSQYRHNRAPSFIEPLEGRTLLSSVITQTFVIDQAHTFATGSMSFTHAPSKIIDNGKVGVGPFHNYFQVAQTPGSLTAHATGTVTAKTSATSIQFVKATIAATNTGIAKPGNTQANYGGVIKNFLDATTGKIINAFIAVRGLVGNLTSPTIALKSGHFSSTSENFTATAGTFSLNQYTLHLKGITIKNQATASGTLTVDKHGNETLTIIAKGSMVFDNGSLGKLTLSVSGKIVAHAKI